MWDPGILVEGYRFALPVQSSDGSLGGYVDAEYAAMGVSFDDRGARLDEYMAAMNALWTMDQPSFHGEYVSFDEVDAYPRP